jgi:serine/threonine protein kinase
VDFGFGCRNYEERMRKTLCGTPSYTPPEVLLRAEYNAELMDVWSLGVTLYTMLAAEMPFEGDQEKRKARIVACKWTPKCFFSPRAQRLLSSIFVLPQNRIILSDLETCEFVQAYPLEQPAFVDPGKELLVPEEGVLSILECMYGFSPKKVA